MSLRVVSYNVRALQDDVSALERTVRALDPDVLCLQEAPYIGPVGHRIAAFAERCHLVWSGREQRAGQTTLLTSLRTQVRQVRHHPLPTAGLLDRRGTAVAQMALVGGPEVTVASVHLGLQPQQRVEHARRILELLGPGPAVIAGDLNEAADGAAWQLLAQRMAPVSPVEPTFPADAPRRSLDVVMATADLQAGPHEAVPLVEEDLVAGTDHRPVWADLTW